MLTIIGMTSVEIEKLASYEIKGVTQILFNQKKEAISEDVGPLKQEKFKSAFRDWFFLLT